MKVVGRVSLPGLPPAISEALERALQTQSASLRIYVKETVTRIAAAGRAKASRSLRPIKALLPKRFGSSAGNGGAGRSSRSGSGRPRNTTWKVMSRISDTLKNFAFDFKGL